MAHLKKASVPAQFNHRGFLSELYLQAFNQDRFRACTSTGLSQEAESLLQRYRELIKDFPPARLEQEGALPEALWQGLKELGIFGLNVSETYGGVGLSLSDYLRIVETMARTDMALALIPIAHLSIGMKGIDLFGTEEQKQKYLAPAASGEMIFAYALTEPLVGSDAQNIQSTAALSEDGDHYILNGRKTYITNGNYAGGLTVFAQMDPAKPGFMGAFIVETAWEGVTIGRDMPKMGLKISSTTPITFENVRVPVENLLGAPGEGFKIAMTILNYGRLGLGAASLGLMKQSVEEMLQRATSRKQFGVPIAEFELIQDKIVKARVHAFVTEAMTCFTARLLEEEPLAKVAIESSHCKLYGTTRAWDTLYDALQVAGGAGYIKTLPYEKRMRDFRVTTVFEGTSEIHSIYPPLFLIRKLSKQMKAQRPGKGAQLWFLLQGLFKTSGISLTYDDPVLRRGVRMARSQALWVNWLIRIGMLLHGKKITEKEFFLTRITELSLNLFGTLSVLAKLASEKDWGEDIRPHLRLFAYFLEQTRESRWTNRRFWTSRKEGLHKSIFQDLKGIEGSRSQGKKTEGVKGRSSGRKTEDGGRKTEDRQKQRLQGKEQR